MGGLTLQRLDAIKQEAWEQSGRQVLTDHFGSVRYVSLKLTA
jgi:hypothetical protein